VGSVGGKFDVILPYAWASGSAKLAGQPREREVSGLGDPRLRFSMLPYGAPALSLAEFADFKPDIIIGKSLEVTAPLGQYDADKLLNIGTNRWSFKPEVGISKTVGPLTLELATGVRFYTDNNDFLDGKPSKSTRSFPCRHISSTPLLQGYGWGSMAFTIPGGGAASSTGKKVKVSGTHAWA
jgi:Putative MetA-pathway of phenol degradation